jgi:hypothetical protein
MGPLAEAMFPGINYFKSQRKIIICNISSQMKSDMSELRIN